MCSTGFSVHKRRSDAIYLGVLPVRKSGVAKIVETRSHRLVNNTNKDLNKVLSFSDTFLYLQNKRYKNH